MPKVDKKAEIEEIETEEDSTTMLATRTTTKRAASYSQRSITSMFTKTGGGKGKGKGKEKAHAISADTQLIGIAPIFSRDVRLNDIRLQLAKDGLLSRDTAYQFLYKGNAPIARGQEQHVFAADAVHQELTDANGEEVEPEKAKIVLSVIRKISADDLFN